MRSSDQGSSEDAEDREVRMVMEGAHRRRTEERVMRPTHLNVSRCEVLQTREALVLEEEEETQPLLPPEGSPLQPPGTSPHRLPTMWDAEIGGRRLQAAAREMLAALREHRAETVAVVDQVAEDQCLLVTQLREAVEAAGVEHPYLVLVVVESLVAAIFEYNQCGPCMTTIMAT